MPKLPRRGLATLAAFGLLSLIVSGGAEQAPPNDIVVGMTAAFTGPSRGLGIELYRGSTAYFDHINSQGGVHGRKIVLKAYDDGYNPAPALDNTIRMIERDEVFLLMNYVGTPTTSRCLPLLKRHRDKSVYLFFPFTGAQFARQPPYGEFVFNLRASYYQETHGLVDHFIEIGRKRVAVFYQIDAYGRTGWEGVRVGLGRHGLKMVGEVTYRRGASYDESMKAQVQILRKTDADAVISVSSYAACAAFVRDARDAGWNVPIANLSFNGSENMVGLLEATGKKTGIDYTCDLINSQVVPSYHDLSLPAIREYRQCMERYNPKAPPGLLESDYELLPQSFVGLEGFLNAKLLVAILQRMKPPLERERLNSTVESMDNVDLGIGVPLVFRPNRHQGMDQVYYTVVHEGRFEPLKDWKRWRQ